ncbi:MAG: hypothetical protein IT249_05715 [Chitinophagaceae bacterium]|nr:hypothetical protein [Chitinophagaceae bacterium]
MKDAKIQFSENELNLAADIDFILTKNRIIGKVYNLFGALAGTYVKLSESLLPQEVLLNSPKISRGENYKGLHYVMLDYPRFFTKDNVFAIRSMFWWGNDLSLTLHLKGKFKAAYQVKLYELSKPGNIDWYIQTSDDEWLHHKTAGSHTKLADITLPENNAFILKTGFLKLTCFLPLQQWNEAATFFESGFNSLITAL